MTTAPAPTTLCSPIETPSSTTAFEPIQTSSPMMIPLADSGCWKTGRSGAMEWLNPRIDVWAPIRTPSPMLTVPRTTLKTLNVQLSPALIVPVM
ncbi:MAG TPA: hypothetical protein VFC59_09550 [Cryobacterium sp.]|nr:hypothetical protein [Cryobacterium sp.]